MRKSFHTPLLPCFSCIQVNKSQVDDLKTDYMYPIFKKRMLNVIIISLQSVNEWPVFNLKKPY
jgi:hypothetical protein